MTIFVKRLTPSAAQDLSLPAEQLVLLAVAEGIDQAAGHADVEVSQLVLVISDLDMKMFFLVNKTYNREMGIACLRLKRERERDLEKKGNL